MLKRLFKEEDGYGTVEMLVLLAGIAGVGAAVVTALGTNVKDANVKAALPANYPGKP